MAKTDTSPPLPEFLVANSAPQDAYVATQYNRRWYWIADTNFQSKYTFGIIMLLFSIADTGVRGAAPHHHDPCAQ